MKGVGLRDERPWRLSLRAAIASGVAVVACLVLVLVDVERVLVSWHVAWLACAGIASGALSLLLLGRLVGGRWPIVIRHPLEAAASSWPLLAVLFVPSLLSILPGGHGIDASAGAPELPDSMRAWLTPAWWCARSIAWLAAWNTLAWLLCRLSRREEEGVSRAGATLRTLAGPALVVQALVVTFAAVDWVMSREAPWYSTVIGLAFLVGQALGALALAILAVAWLGGEGERGVPADRFHDLGNLLLVLVMTWTYLAFVQYIVTWSGDLPEEVQFYLRRRHGAWGVVALVLVTLHFAVPFLVLLSRRVKRRPRALAVVAAGLLALRFVDVSWWVLPAWGPASPVLLATVPAAVVAIGGACLAWSARDLARRGLLPAGGDALAPRDGTTEPRHA